MPRPNFVDIGEVLHDLDETHDGADDADRRRVAAGGFENGRNLFFDLGLIRKLELHNLAYLRGFRSVDREHQGLFEETDRGRS